MLIHPIAVGISFTARFFVASTRPLAVLKDLSARSSPLINNPRRNINMASGRSNDPLVWIDCEVELSTDFETLCNS